MLQSRQVEAFRAVMLTGAMTAAADMLHITQPAVSRLVRDLELALKLKLFYRSGNSISPTAEALDLFAEVERSFVGLDRLRERAEALRSGRTGSLMLAAVPAMATSFLPRFLAGFCRARPGLKVLIDSIPSDLVLERVESGQFDIGITAMASERSSLKVIRIHAGAVVAMPAGHRLAARPAVRAEDLEDENLIMPSTRVYGRHAMELALQGIRRHQAIETPLSHIGCVMVAEGMGLAIVDPFSASDFVERGVVLRPFDSSFSITYNLVHAGSRPLSAVAQEFTAALLDHIRHFLERGAYIAALPGAAGAAP